ncbi:ankyrin repeat domain-containing protein [Sphingobacterium lactis]|uniref:ankyrin repeat domain-containing protein n=1 Tax=Sphingobacterium lactis TaxID=797291 RepID=UPI003F7ED303
MITKTFCQTALFSLLLFSLFIINSCNGQNNSKRSEKPKIDIHTAIITDNKEILQKYIDTKTSLAEKEPMNASTPLITAAVFGRTEMVKMLIDAPVDLNTQNKDGSTALHTAAFFCRPDIVKLLLKKGANKSIKNKYGQTAYQTVSGPYMEVKEIYKGLAAILAPAGLKLDFNYIEKTRPQIASLLK